MRMNKFTGGKDEPEAPAETETNDGVFEADDQWPSRYVAVVDGVGQEHETAGQEHRVPSVTRHRHQQNVHQQPRGERSPKKQINFGRAHLITALCNTRE